MCPLCNLAEENTLHIIRECSFAKAIWTLSEIDPSLPTGDRESWLRSNVHAKDICKNIPWHTLFPIVCNEIWISRNKKIFEDKTIPSPAHILKKALFLAHEFISSTPIAPVLNTAPVAIPSIIGPSWYTIQVDASFLDAQNHAGIGGWIRDNEDTWISGFQKQVYVADVLMAELMGILEGIQLAKRNHLDHVLVCSDNLQATKMLSQDVIHNDLYCNVLKICRECTREFMGIQFVFVRRKLNKMADYLARGCRKQLMTQNEVRIIPQPPNDCMELIFSDCCRLSS